MTDSETTTPIALARDGGEALWFMGSLALVKADSQTTAGRVAVIEHVSRPQEADRRFTATLAKMSGSM